MPEAEKTRTHLFNLPPSFSVNSLSSFLSLVLASLSSAMISSIRASLTDTALFERSLPAAPPAAGTASEFELEGERIEGEEKSEGSRRPAEEEVAGPARGERAPLGLGRARMLVLERAREAEVEMEVVGRGRALVPGWDWEDSWRRSAASSSSSEELSSAMSAARLILCNPAETIKQFSSSSTGKKEKYRRGSFDSLPSRSASGAS